MCVVEALIVVASCTASASMYLIWGIGIATPGSGARGLCWPDAVISIGIGAPLAGPLVCAVRLARRKKVLFGNGERLWLIQGLLTIGVVLFSRGTYLLERYYELGAAGRRVLPEAGFVLVFGVLPILEAVLGVVAVRQLWTWGRRRGPCFSPPTWTDRAGTSISLATSGMYLVSILVCAGP